MICFLNRALIAIGLTLVSSVIVVGQDVTIKGRTLIQDIVNEVKVPSLSVAVYQANMPVFQYAYGVKEWNRQDSVCIHDPYHIGSIGKSMTATWIAYLVERGDLTWETSILDVFPHLDSLQSPQADATLIHLLTNSSGLVDLFSAEDWRTMDHSIAWIEEQQSDLMIRALQNPDNGRLGVDWAYANVNFTIAALMTQDLSGIRWEEGIRSFFMEEMGIALGFGWPKDTHSKTVPKGHVLIDGRYEVWGPDHPHQVPITIRPAGDIHMTISSLAKFGAYHCTGLKAGQENLGREQFLKLHQPSLEGYAMGWNILPQGSPSIPNVEQHQHLGSGGTFKALLAIFPKEDLSIAIAHNGGGDNTSLSKALVGLFQLFGIQ